MSEAQSFLGKAHLDKGWLFLFCNAAKKCEKLGLTLIYLHQA